MNPAQSPQVQQLLDKMHGIQAPPPVSWWPPAPGWWILGALVLLLLMVLVLWARRRRARNAYRREALRAASGLHDCELESLLPQTNSLLKRVALHAYPLRLRQINGAFGQAWVDWLNARCNQPVFTGAAAEQLAAGGYAPHGPVDREAVIGGLKRWIQDHRPEAQRHV